MSLNLGRKNRPFNKRPNRDVVQVGRDTDSARQAIADRALIQISRRSAKGFSAAV
jgi:hypothetical protein